MGFPYTPPKMGTSKNVLDMGFAKVENANKGSLTYRESR